MWKASRTTFSIPPKFSATPLFTSKTARSAARSVKSQLFTLYYHQKPSLPLTDLVRLITSIIPHSNVPTAADGFSAAYLLTALAQQIGHERSLHSHLCSALYGHRQNFTLTYFVRPTLLSVSSSTVTTAADGYFATYLRTMLTNQYDRTS